MIIFSYKFFFQLINKIPFSVAFFCSKYIGLFLYYIKAAPAKITVTNLRLAFPHFSKKEISKLAISSLQETLKCSFENFKIWNGSSVFLNSLAIEVEGLEFLENSLKIQNGLILFTPHQGNIEILIYYLAKNYNCTIPYTMAKNQLLQNMMLQSRNSIGAKMVSTDMSGVRSLIKTLKNNTVVAMAPDQVPDNKKGVIAKFFNKDALTITLLSNLAIKTKSPCHSMCCIRKKENGSYKIIFSKRLADMNEDITTSVNTMNNALEKCIMIAPDQYAWEYKRYKHSSNKDYYESL